MYGTLLNNTLSHIHNVDVTLEEKKLTLKAVLNIIILINDAKILHLYRKRIKLASKPSISYILQCI